MLSSPIKSLGKSYSHVNFLGEPLKKMLDDEAKLGNSFYVVEPVKDIKEMKQNFINYCKRDVEIARKSLLDFTAAINTLPSIKNYVKDIENKKVLTYRKRGKQYNPDYTLKVNEKSLTIAGFSRWLMKNIYIPKFQKSNEKYYSNNVFNHNENKYGNFLFIDKETHEFIKNDSKVNYYNGAFTQFNPTYQAKRGNENNKHVNSGIKIDVVSAYPYQMTKSLPFGTIIDENTFYEYYFSQNPHWKQGEDYIEFLELKIKRLTPKKINSYCPVLKN